MVPNQLFSLKHRFSPVVYLLLVLALLLAQGAAQAHVYSHLSGAPATKTDFSGAAGQVCSECLASAPLLSAAGAPDSPLLAFDATLAAPVVSAPLPRLVTLRYYAFRARAPPTLL